jgi:hypothetical protein
MSIPKQDGAFLLRLEQPLTKEHATEHADAIANAMEEMTDGSALRLVIPSPEGPDGLAVLLAAAKECRTRSVELHLRLPKELSELAEDLRLAKHAELEITEGAP